MGRWGEKVPAAVGTVANRFALLQLAALHVKGAILAAEGTMPSTLGTGLLFPQGNGLLFEKGLQGSFGESRRRRAGELLHGIEIDIEAGAFVAEGTAGDNFAPLSGEGSEFLKLFGSEGAACHDASCIEVGTTVKEKMVLGNLLPSG